MDYEKKYKEIVGQIKKAYLYAQTDSTKAVLEEIFPELAESEDEKIMGKIIGTIHLYYGEPLEDEAKEMITWIEKQGEHANFRNKIQIGDKVTRNEDGVLVNISQLNRIAKERKNQGEQKPAEWSEEDENGLGDALWAIQQARTIAKDENDMGNLWYAENWLKSLKERYTWKPSEEQMNAFDSTLQYSKVSHNSFDALNSLFNDLKKLREE